MALYIFHLKVRVAYQLGIMWKADTRSGAQQFCRASAIPLSYPTGRVKVCFVMYIRWTWYRELFFQTRDPGFES